MLESSGASRVVPLSNYRDEADYRVIMGTSEFSFEEWRTLNMATMELLRDGGCVVVLADLVPEEYLLWLRHNGLVNDTQARAQYASLRAIPPR